MADRNEEQGRRVADRFGVKWFKDFKDLLQYVDAVSIAVPTSLHLEVTKEALRSGVHSLVEKPLSDNIKDAEEIVSLADGTDLTLAVGHVERHNPVVNYAKKAIEEGIWGDIITLTSKRVSNFPARITDVEFYLICVSTILIFPIIYQILKLIQYMLWVETK